MAQTWSPHVSRKANIISLSYELPYRVRTAKVYPITASNGSTIIVCGTDSGICAIWRGGKIPEKCRKSARQSSRPSRRRSKSRQTDPVEMIEVEGEDDDTVNSGTCHTYPDLDDARDWLKPYPPILKQTAIPFGSAVLDLAFPASQPISVFKGTGEATPNDHLFVAALCADYSVRIIRLRLELLSTARAAVATISMPSIASSLSLTWSEGLDSNTADLFVAIASDEARGFLRFFRIPSSGFGGSHSPFLKRHHPHRIVRVAFKPPHGSSGNRSHILIAEATGVVRLFDPLCSEQGSFLRHLTTPFVRTKPGDGAIPSLPALQQVVDAQWTHDGKAIFVLLANGEWGLWTLDGGGPTSKNKSSPGDGFYISGVVGGPASVSPAISQSKKTRGGRSSLAPSTPNTRQAKQKDLFNNLKGTDEHVRELGLALQALPFSSEGGVEDCVTIWHDQKIYSMPSLQAFLCRTARDVSAGEPLNAAGLVLVEGVELYGEKITSVNRLPSKQSGSQKNFVIAAEHHLIFIENDSSSPESATAATWQRDKQDNIDRLDLARGDLDIGGLDRLLNKMNAYDDDDILMIG